MKKIFIQSFLLVCFLVIILLSCDIIEKCSDISTTTRSSDACWEFCKSEGCKASGVKS